MSTHVLLLLPQRQPATRSRILVSCVLRCSVCRGYAQISCHPHPPRAHTSRSRDNGRRWRESLGRRVVSELQPPHEALRCDLCGGMEALNLLTCFQGHFAALALGHGIGPSGPVELNVCVPYFASRRFQIWSRNSSMHCWFLQTTTHVSILSILWWIKTL